MDTYEKKYKELVAKIKNAHLYAQTDSTKNVLEGILPELAESEDERILEIIKHCIESRYLHTSTIKGISQKQCFAWLEKQGEPQDKGEISDGYHTFNELYYYRMLYNAAFFNMLPKEWVHKSKKHHDGEDCFGGGWFIVMANLPTGQISNHYELKDWDLFQIPEKEVADKWDGHTPQEAADRLHKYLLEKQGEQNIADKIKPKFHEGDWITNGDYTWKIIEVKPLDYILKAQDGNIVDDTISYVDEQFHSFTVKDAKDGDVLASKDGQSILIFRNLDTSTSFSSYYNIQEKGELGWSNECFIPATKEQHDLLFSKMNEAGYEWDAETHELKKIKKNTDVVHEYFSELLENNNSKDINDYAYQVAYCMSHDWMKESPTWDDVEEACKIGAKWNERHHKSAEWSEEEEVKINRIVACLENLNVADNDILLKDVDWLKSLKERYFWKPKTWEIQILESVIEKGENPKNYSVTLHSILEQLKKLKGE